MSDFADLLRELKKLEQIQSDLAEMGRRDDEARKADTVNLRRLLAQQLGTLGELGRQVIIAETDQQLYADFRARLSAMRHAIAMHQADWPAISLDYAHPDYLLSATRVLKAKEEFTQWAIAIFSAKAKTQGD